MPRPEHVDLAHLLLRKAAADLAVTRTLAADADPHDEAIGFHAQQAVEKAIKAVLALSQIAAPRTHDLTYLVELLDAHGIDVPATIAEPDGSAPGPSPPATTTSTTRLTAMPRSMPLTAPSPGLEYSSYKRPATPTERHRQPRNPSTLRLKGVGLTGRLLNQSTRATVFRLHMTLGLDTGPRQRVALVLQ